jgi:hypothetical protein
MSNRPRLFFFVVTFTLLLARSLVVRSLSDPWLEDIELLLASMDSRVSLLTPVYDNPLIVQRIIARVVEPFIGLEHGPHFFGLLSISFLAYVSTYIMRPGFEWLIPGLRIRAAIAVWIGLGPGTVDIAGCLINTSYTLSLLVLIMSLERCEERYAPLVIVSILASLSCHTAFIAAPVLLLRAIVEKRRWPFAISLLCITLSVLLGAIRNHSLSSSPPSLVASNYLHTTAEFLTFWLQSFFIGPIAGSTVAYFCYQVWPLNFLFILMGFGVWVTLCRAASKPIPFFVGAITLGSLLFVAAYAVGRAHSGLGLTSLVFGIISRHNSIQSVTMMLSWAALVPWGLLASSRIGRIAVALPFAMHLAVLVSMWTHYSRPPERHWPQAIGALRLLAASISNETEEVRLTPYPLEQWASDIACRKEHQEIRCSGTWSGKDHNFIIPIRALTSM